jgi:hypothetical protein
MRMSRRKGPHAAKALTPQGEGNSNRAPSIAKVARVAREINWRVCHDRTKRDSATREKHLRSLMGLPEAPRPETDQGRNQ